MKPKSLKPPALLHHKPSGRAYVMARDDQGNRRMVYLGAHGSAASERAYRQFLSEFYAGHPARVPQPKQLAAAAPFTVEDLCTEFMLYAESRYRREDGTATKEALNFAHAFRHLLKLYRDIPAEQFDVTMLEAVQMDMVRDGLARSCVNSRTARIRRTYRWAARKKLVSATTWHELQTLPGLRRGEHGVRESPPIDPVPEADVEEVLPFLSKQIATMVRLQMSTGCRPGEMIVMRMAMIDRTDPEAWIYRPPHKNSWRDQDRTIPLLSGDQELLRPFLRLDDKPLFSPREAELARGRDAEKLGEVYTVHSYRRGITRGVMGANAARVRRRLLELLADELSVGTREQIERLSTRRLITGTGELRRDIEKVVVPLTGKGEMLESTVDALRKLALMAPWAPNRVRHLAATKAAPLVGDDGVQLLLGHADARTLRHSELRQASGQQDVADAESRRCLMPMRRRSSLAASE